MNFIAAVKSLFGMDYGNGDYYDPQSVDDESENQNSPRTRKRRMNLVKLPSARDKYIYTMQPTSYEDAAIAADYLKCGAAIFVNLQNVDSNMGRRMVDALSGVCYGVDGHSHKVGDRLFLFLPHDFYITSEEKSHLESHGLFLNGFRESLKPVPQMSQTQERKAADTDSFDRTGLFSYSAQGR